MLGRRHWPIVRPQIQEEECGFHPGCGTVDQVFALSCPFGAASEFADSVYVYFVDLEKAYDQIT